MGKSGAERVPYWASGEAYDPPAHPAQLPLSAEVSLEIWGAIATAKMAALSIPCLRIGLKTASGPGLRV